MNLWPQKGCIAPESDADLVIWNPNNFRTISSKEESESNADVNAFDGLTVHGAPEYVIANGKVLLQLLFFFIAITVFFYCNYCFLLQLLHSYCNIKILQILSFLLQ